MKVGTRKEKRMEITLHGVGWRKEEGEARKGKGAKRTKEENEEIIHECGRRKEESQDKCKEKRRMKKTGNVRGKKVSRRILLKEQTGKRCKKQVDATKFQTNGREIKL